jgi:hypothetical protein
MATRTDPETNRSTVTHPAEHGAVLKDLASVETLGSTS